MPADRYRGSTPRDLDFAFGEVFDPMQGDYVRAVHTQELRRGQHLRQSLDPRAREDISSRAAQYLHIVAHCLDIQYVAVRYRDVVVLLLDDQILRFMTAACIDASARLVDRLIETGEEKMAAILKVVRTYIKTCKPIHFDGNGYSDEWKEEARKRGLDCETSVPLIFDNYLTESSIKMFEQTGVMTQKELEARNEVKWETYTKKIQIEARVLGDLAMNHIIPVATQYQTSLIDNVYKIRSLFPEEKGKTLSSKNIELIEAIAEHTAFIKEHVDQMVEARKVANKIDTEREKAIAYHDYIVPALEKIRYHIDKLELIVDDQMWTLPKYRELLFIR